MQFAYSGRDAVEVDLIAVEIEAFQLVHAAQSLLKSRKHSLAPYRLLGRKEAHVHYTHEYCRLKGGAPFYSYKIL